MLAKYVLNITLTVPVDEGDDPSRYIDKQEQRRLEKAVIKAWKLDGDVDCECLEAEIVDDDGQPIPERDEEYERAAAHARSNNFADTGGKDWT